ncbi:MAG: hypothetical protein KDD38_02710 [Bdellovibrionales bacterium]|nr:hypothetical protein [Bdellovibrionales bacterium]
MKKLILIGASVFAVGCGEGFQNNSGLSDLNSVSEGIKTGLGDLDKPYCEVDFVDYELDTSLLAFEITGNNNIGFGFDILKGFLNALSLNIKTEKGKMQASMHLSEALRPKETIVDVMGVGELSKSEFNINLDAGRLGLELGYFRQTPLFKLTQKTMANSLQNLTKELNSVETDWSTRIVHIYQDQAEFIIPAGSVAGIRVGDRFKIYNVDYTWKDEPCASDLVFRPKRTTSPIAILQVIQLEKNASLLKIVERPSDQNIEAGAIVEVHNLPLAKNEKSRAALSRSVRLKNFTSQELLLPGGKTADLTIYLEEQTAALLSKYGLYPRK